MNKSNRTNKPGQTQPGLMMDPNVQAALLTLEGLVTGRKRLVIDSIPIEICTDPGGGVVEPRYATGFKHIIKVENSDEGTQRSAQTTHAQEEDPAG